MFCRCMQKWETLEKHVSAANVSGNMFPRKVLRNLDCRAFSVLENLAWQFVAKRKGLICDLQYWSKSLSTFFSLFNRFGLALYFDLQELQKESYYRPFCVLKILTAVPAQNSFLLVSKIWALNTCRRKCRRSSEWLGIFKTYRSLN